MTQERKPAVLLIAEDDKEMRSLLCDELFDLGVSIREAADGDEALRSVLDARPSLILTDLRMPGLDGQELLARVGQLAPDVPVVIMTAHGTIRSAVQALRDGAEDYLTKPVDVAFPERGQSLTGTCSYTLHWQSGSL